MTSVTFTPRNAFFCIVCFDFLLFVFLTLTLTGCQSSNFTCESTPASINVDDYGLNTNNFVTPLMTDSIERIPFSDISNKVNIPTGMIVVVLCVLFSTKLLVLCYDCLSCTIFVYRL